MNGRGKKSSTCRLRQFEYCDDNTGQCAAVQVMSRTWSWATSVFRSAMSVLSSVFRLAKSALAVTCSLSCSWHRLRDALGLRLIELVLPFQFPG